MKSYRLQSREAEKLKSKELQSSEKNILSTLRHEKNGTKSTLTKIKVHSHNKTTRPPDSKHNGVAAMRGPHHATTILFSPLRTKSPFVNDRRKQQSLIFPATVLPQCLLPRFISVVLVPRRPCRGPQDEMVQVHSVPVDLELSSVVS